MKYMILDEDGKEYGPVDAETLKKWVEHGRVFKETRVRNELIKRWDNAGELDFLKEAFEGQADLQAQEVGIFAKLFRAVAPPKTEEVATDKKEVTTSFKNKYVPAPAAPMQRLYAFICDAVLLTVLAAFLFCVMNLITGTFALGDFTNDLGKSEIAAGLSSGAEMDADAADAEVAAERVRKQEELADSEKAQEAAAKAAAAAEELPPPPHFVPTKEQTARLNKLFLVFGGIFAMATLLYYGIGLGLYAQTYGMHYWGIFIVKGHDKEAFPLRAYTFFLASIPLCALTPVFVLFNPSRRTLHGYLTGCRLIRITAKAK